MVGQYLNKKQEYKRILSDWIDYSIKNESWKKYQDLHLDEIDLEFQQRTYWIKGSIFIYEIILNIIKPDLYSCLLVIPLSYSNKETDISQLTWNDIDILLDLSPPSFYLFPNGEKNYEETIKSLNFMESFNSDCTYKVFFKQEEEIKGEYNRSIYIIDR